MEVSTVALEDNNSYIIIDTIVYNNSKYLILSKEDDSYDICLRKVIIKDNLNYLVKLENEEEFKEIIRIFSNKYGKVEEL